MILGIKVKKETTTANLFAIFFVPFLMAAKYGFLQVQITFLLESEDYFAINPSEVGRKNSYLIFWQSGIALCFLPFIGYLYEFLGRRLVIVMCLFASVALFLLVPFTAPNYYFLVIVKSLTYLLGTIVDGHPLIPDYVKSESRGRAVSCAVLGSILGEVFSMTVLIGLSIDMRLDESFVFVAIICGGLTCLIPMIIREPVIKPPEPELNQNSGTGVTLTKKEKVKILTQEAIDLIKNDGRYVLCFMGVMLTRLMV